jgi:EmrB/QacA subfamily drug resistance transporter
VTAQDLNDQNRWLALYVLCMGVLMIVIDATIVNVALPSIQDDLGFSQSNLAWVVNAYMIPFGGLLLLSGRLGDLIGQRKIFLIGLAIFTVASLLCAVAQTQGMLIAARFVQGAGGALSSAVVLAMIVRMFPQPAEQAKAIGVFGFVASAGGSIGLLAGGALTEAISWHWIFFINVPIGIATAIAARRLVPAYPGVGLGQGADIPGAALLTAGLMLGVYNILQISEEGWFATQTLILGTISLGLIVAFVLRQARITNPLVPLRLFRSANVSGANVVQALVVAGMFGMFFMGALYLQQVLGYDPLEVGLAFLPATIAMGTMSLKVSDRVNMRFGPKAVLIPALVALAAALLLMARTPVDGEFVADLLAPMTLMGLGAGLAFPALMSLAMGDVDMEDSGLASGLVNTSVQVGGAIGLAVLATLATERTDSLTSDGESTLAALNGGFHLAYLLGAVLIGISIVVAFVFLKSPDMSAMMAAHGEGEDAEHERERAQAEAALSEAA